MSHYQYICSNCRNQFKAQDIESAWHYLCPHCGRAEKNMPLQGVLQLEYDYETIRKKYSRLSFMMTMPGQFWLYPELWPLETEENILTRDIKVVAPAQLQKLCLNANPIFTCELAGQSIAIFDDTRNPTLSFKDRASSLVAVKALQLGCREIAVASTGNAASSLAGICARLGLTAHVFVPETIPAAKRIQIQAYGARIYLVQGDYDQAFDLTLEIAAAKKWYNRNTAYNPLTLEGKKSAAFDIFFATRGNMPEVIVIPVGDGVVIAGIMKGITELIKMDLTRKFPRLYAIQAEGSDALVRFLQSGSFEYRPAQTIADSLAAGAPRNLYLAARAVQASRGAAIAVSDHEILQAQQTLAQQAGILAEPAAAASLAGYRKLRESGQIHLNEKVLLLLTGSGLKDTAALQQWNPVPAALSPEQWRERLLS